jgi:lipoate-protein ligase A
MIDLHMDVKQAVIEAVVIFSDVLNVELIESLKSTLTGIKYNKNDIKAKIEDLARWYLPLLNFPRIINYKVFL